MRHAPTRNSIDYVNAGGGLLLRMRAWFARGGAPYESVLHDERVDKTMPGGAIAVDCGVHGAGLADAGSSDIGSVAVQEKPRSSAALFSFPIRGEALLVKLADQLRDRVAGNSFRRDPFLLILSRRPHSRLTIDGAAYLDFDAAQAIFRLVIELVQDTRIVVESCDFDTIVKFIAQYVTDRLSGELTGESAS